MGSLLDMEREDRLAAAGIHLLDELRLWDDRAVQVERNTGRRVDGRDG